jgi:hypothetical protein
MSADNGPKKTNLTRAISPNQMMMRRIIRNGDFFICGICRTKHSSQNQAASCLVTCWKMLLERAPWVVEVRGIGKYPYACAYCQRGYATPEQAHSCAQDCVNKLNTGSAPENVSTKQKISRPFSKPSAKSTVRLAFQNLIARRKLADARIEAERLAAEQAKENPPKSETAGAEKESPAQKESLEFLCESCKKSHPTKDKADECMASHSKKGEKPKA